jgi:protein TonB
MMIRTAGGPGLVSPIDFHERKTPRLSRSAWTAIALVAAAHIGVGVALYYQRFELKTLQIGEPPTLTGPIITLEPMPKPEPVEAKPEPAAPNTAIHHPETAPPVGVETLPATPSDDASTATGPVISVTRPVPDPVDTAPPARETVPESPPARVIRNPSWVSQPTGEQLMRAYPDRALERGLAGSAALNCMVEANGSVSGCSITGETPAGQGFGRAAQQLSRYFRINPRTVDGAAEGSRVAINLRFVPPAD